MKPDLNCTLCDRLTPPEHQEKHHLVPKSRKGTETILLCRNCGDQVHKLFSNKELEQHYNTVASLLANPGIQKWINWVQRQDSFTFSMKSKKQRR